MAFVTLYIVWWCCERTHDVVSGTTVHTSPYPPLHSWCCCTTSRLSCFCFFFYHEGHEIHCLRTACVLLRFLFLASVILFGRTSARLYPPFRGFPSDGHFRLPSQPGFSGVLNFHPHFFEFSLFLFDCRGAELLCLPVSVGDVVDLKGLACMHWAYSL